MARTRRRSRLTRAQTLTPVVTACPECRHKLWADYTNYRTVTTLEAAARLTLHVRRCPNPACPRYRRPYRPEAEPTSPYPTTSSASTSSPSSANTATPSTAAPPRSTPR
jgi:hypothetical protein